MNPLHRLYRWWQNFEVTDYHIFWAYMVLVILTAMMLGVAIGRTD